MAPPTMMDTGSITPTRTSLDRWIGRPETLRAAAARTVSDARPRAESLNAAALTGTLVAAKAAILTDLPNAKEPCELHGVTRARAVQCRGRRAGFNFAKQAQPSNLSIFGTPLADVFNFEKTGGCFLVFKKFFVTDEPYEVGPKGKLATFENGPASRLLASIEERLASFVLRRTRGAHSGSGG
jgi:hypothetical protein